MSKIAAVLSFVLVWPSPAFARNSTLHSELVPAPLIRAMQEVHGLAAGADLRNLFMYRYTYYKGGFCAEQNCAPDFVAAQIEMLKNRMGAEFEDLNKKYESYAAEIRTALASATHKDLDNLMSYRSAADILERRVFTTCVDFAKGIAAKALAHGMRPHDLRFFWTMGKEGFAKMCPTLHGQPAVPPRPVVHTIIAYRHEGSWYAMNSENPNPEIIPLGRQLPRRHSRNFIFASPALVSGLPLTYAGSYSFRDFLDGFANQTILNIAASGRNTADPADFICR